MKTQMSRFQIHDDLTAPEASLPVVKGALAGAGQLPNFLGVLAGSPAALRGYARFRSELRSNGTLTLHDARADRARRRRAPRLQARARAPRPHRPPGRPRPRRGRARPRVGLARRARGGAAALPARRSPSSAPASEPPARGGARGRLERRAAARGDRDRGARGASRRWSTSPATCRPTARWRTRASCAPPEPDGPGAPAAGSRSRRWHRPGECCPYLHEAVELVGKRWIGRDRLRAARGRRDALLGDRRRGAAAVRPPAVRAHEGARGARDRRAPRAARARRRASSTG